MDRHIDFVGKSGEGFVDGVVDDFVNQMMQSHLAGRTDVHRGTFAHSLHAAEHFDGVGGVIAITAGNGFAIFYF